MKLFEILRHDLVVVGGRLPRCLILGKWCSQGVYRRNRYSIPLDLPLRISERDLFPRDEDIFQTPSAEQREMMFKYEAAAEVVASTTEKMGWGETT